MTATAERIDVRVSVRARASAIGWLNAFLAAGSDEQRPAINRTLALEWFEGGVQFICTDGTALFRSWVPAVPDSSDASEAEWPVVAEAPIRTVVIMDADGFAVSFMRTLLSVTNDEGHEFDELTVTSAMHDDEADLALGPEFMGERLTLRACGQRIDLKLYEGPFPDWRRARLGIDNAERVEGLTLAPRLLALVGKLKGASRVDMEFYGDKNHVAFVARGDSETRGLLMPMRRMDVEKE